MEEKKVKLDKLVTDYTSNKITYKEFEVEVKMLYTDKEGSKPNLNPFDIEAAKAGKPVCTRDGRKARIICFDLNNDEYPIVAAITNNGKEDELYKYDINGINGTIGILDLMMLPEKKEGWINVYNNPTTHNIYTSADVFESKEIAEGQGTQRNRIATCKITWEE